MAPRTFTYEIQLELIQNYSVLVFVGQAIAVFSDIHCWNWTGRNLENGAGTISDVEEQQHTAMYNTERLLGAHTISRAFVQFYAAANWFSGVNCTLSLSTSHLYALHLRHRNRINKFK